MRKTTSASETSLRSSLPGAQPPRTFPETPPSVTDPQSSFSGKRTARTLPAGFLPLLLLMGQHLPPRQSLPCAPGVCDGSVWAAPGEAGCQSYGAFLLAGRPRDDAKALPRPRLEERAETTVAAGLGTVAVCSVSTGRM